MSEKVSGLRARSRFKSFLRSRPITLCRSVYAAIVCTAHNTPPWPLSIALESLPPPLPKRGIVHFSLPLQATPLIGPLLYGPLIQVSWFLPLLWSISLYLISRKLWQASL